MFFRQKQTHFSESLRPPWLYSLSAIKFCWIGFETVFQLFVFPLISSQSVSNLWSCRKRVTTLVKNEPWMKVKSCSESWRRKRQKFFVVIRFCVKWRKRWLNGQVKKILWLLINAKLLLFMFLKSNFETSFMPSSMQSQQFVHLLALHLLLFFRDSVSIALMPFFSLAFCLAICCLYFRLSSLVIIIADFFILLLFPPLTCHASSTPSASLFHQFLIVRHFAELCFDRIGDLRILQAPTGRSLKDWVWWRKKQWMYFSSFSCLFRYLCGGDLWICLIVFFFFSFLFFVFS